MRARLETPTNQMSAAFGASNRCDSRVVVPQSASCVLSFRIYIRSYRCRYVFYRLDDMKNGPDRSQFSPSVGPGPLVSWSGAKCDILVHQIALSLMKINPRVIEITCLESAAVGAALQPVVSCLAFASRHPSTARGTGPPRGGATRR